MKRIALITGLAVMLASCGQTAFSSDSAKKDYRDERLNNATLHCRDHVEYMFMPNSYGGTFTPHLQVDGKPYTC